MLFRSVLVRDGEIVGEGATQPPGEAHAEIVALRAAGPLARHSTLYVTLEPCSMCAGAIVLARLGRVVYGAADPKAGGCGSVLDVLGERRLNHRAELTGGVLAEECGEVLREFFRNRRKATLRLAEAGELEGPAGNDEGGGSD